MKKVKYLCKLVPGEELNGLEGKLYVVEKFLGDGGKGIAYVAKSGNERYVLKLPKLSIEFPADEIRERLETLVISARREYELFSSKFDINSAAITTIDLCRKPVRLKDGRRSEATINVQRYVKGKTLDRFLRDSFPERCLDGEKGLTDPFCGVPDFSTWHKWAFDIASALLDVHRQRIVHSDLWPPNVMIQSPGKTVKIIDFGEAWDNQEQPHQQSRKKQYHQFFAPEISGGVWRTAADIYSYGGILLYLAAGNISSFSTVDDSDQLRELIVNAIRQRNPRLLTGNDGLVPIIHRCLRYEIHERASTMQAVLDDLRLFSPSTHHAVVVSRRAIVKDLEECRNLVEKADKPNQLFIELIQRQTRLLREQMASCEDEGRLFEAYGDREDLLHCLVQSMSGLNEGDLYAAVTLPALWCRTGLGLHGRFNSMNMLCARRGVILKRVFMLSEDELKNGRVQDVLRAHRRGLIDLNIQTLDNKDKKIDSGTCYVGVEIVKPEEKKLKIKLGLNFGLIRKENVELNRLEYTRVALDYQIAEPNSQRARITNIRFWSVVGKKLKDEYLAQLQDHLDKSQSIFSIELSS